MSALLDGGHLGGLPILVGVLSGLSTLAGGALALRFRSSIDLFLGFSAGAVIGVALLDLLPEALELAQSARPAIAPTLAMVLGFAAYFTIDRALAALSGADRSHRGFIGPASLTLHSLMDGLGIGLAFHVSTVAGLVVALAVLAHDMLDGVNTVALGLSGGDRNARRWLVADALAPMVGILIGRMIAVPPEVLAVLMAVFAGFFLYVGAGELLPQVHDRRPRLSTVAATLAGLAVIWAVVSLAGG